MFSFSNFWKSVVLLWGHWHPGFGLPVMSTLCFRPCVLEPGWIPHFRASSPARDRFFFIIVNFVHVHLYILGHKTDLDQVKHFSRSLSWLHDYYYLNCNRTLISRYFSFQYIVRLSLSLITGVTVFVLSLITQ